MIVDARHALFVGWVLGIAQRQGLAIRPILDDADNYTDRLAVELELELERDRGITRCSVTMTIVIPPPPDEWSLE